MSRRDTIIIAVLVNAGLLMVLFATAMRSNKKEENQGAELADASPTKEMVSSFQGNDLMQPLAMPESNILDAPLSLQAPAMGNSGDLFDGALATTEEIDIPIATNSLPAAPVQAAPTLVAPPVAAPLVVTPAVKKEESVVASNATVTVKKGDVLEKIAKNNGTSVAAIMKTNNLQSTNLKIGQVLKMPAGSVKKESAAVAKTSTPASGTSSSSEYYTVKEGDNPWLIASRNNVKLDELLKLNGMDEQKAKKLRPGDRLRIR
jgi:peptidoglycan endopeptidase LytF